MTHRFFAHLIFASLKWFPNWSAVFACRTGRLNMGGYIILATELTNSPCLYSGWVTKCPAGLKKKSFEGSMANHLNWSYNVEIETCSQPCSGSTWKFLYLLADEWRLKLVLFLSFLCFFFSLNLSFTLYLLNTGYFSRIFSFMLFFFLGVLFSGCSFFFASFFWVFLVLGHCSIGVHSDYTTPKSPQMPLFNNNILKLQLLNTRTM